MFDHTFMSMRVVRVVAHPKTKFLHNRKTKIETSTFISFSQKKNGGITFGKSSNKKHVTEYHDENKYE
jgi:hypothetical protein